MGKRISQFFLGVLIILLIFELFPLGYQFKSDLPKTEDEIGEEALEQFLYSSAKFDWETPLSKNVGEEPNCVVVGDVNNDGLNDIVVSNKRDDNISIFIWNSSLSYFCL